MFDRTRNSWLGAEGLKIGHISVSPPFASSGTGPDKSLTCYLARIVKRLESILAYRPFNRSVPLVTPVFHALSQLSN